MGGRRRKREKRKEKEKKEENRNYFKNFSAMFGLVLLFPPFALGNNFLIVVYLHHVSNKKYDVHFWSTFKIKH